jgi:hypothetical protein
MWVLQQSTVSDWEGSRRAWGASDAQQPPVQGGPAGVGCASQLELLMLPSSCITAVQQPLSPNILLAVHSLPGHIRLL